MLDNLWYYIEMRSQEISYLSWRVLSVTWMGVFHILLTPIQKYVWRDFVSDFLVGYCLKGSVDSSPKVGDFSGAIPASRNAFT